jgi:hypothetical protein
VVADASSVPDDIRKSVDDATTSFHDPGSRAAKEFKRGWQEELENHSDRDLTDAFNRALIHDEATGRFFQTQEWRNVERNFKAKFGSIGQGAADEIREKFLKSGSLQGIERDIENVASRVNAIFDRALADNARVSAQRTKEMEDFEKRFRAAMEESAQVSQRVSRDNVNNLESLRRKMENLSITVGRFRESWRRAEVGIDSMYKKLRAGSKDVDRNANVFGRLARTIDHIALGVGRAFGKGSRNDLLNFVGSFVGNVTRLISLPFRILDNIGQFTKGFKDALNAGQGFFSAIKIGFSEMAKDAEGGSTALAGAFSNLLVALPALVVAIVAIVAVLGIVTALISGVIAALLALASTITFAAIGALSALAAILPAIAAGLGVIVLGIATMDDKTKKALTNALKPFLDSLKELGGVARSGFIDGLGASFDRLSGSLDVLKPLVHDIGEAVGDIARRFINLGQKPGPLRFFTTLEDAAPRIVHDLGRVVLNLTRALSNLFADAVPLAEEFTGWLVEITRNFRIWVFEHPEAIVDFLRRAGDAAEVLGGFLGSIVNLIATLFNSGLGTGNSILESLTRNINEFANSIKPTGTPGQTVFGETIGDIDRLQGKLTPFQRSLKPKPGERNIFDEATRGINNFRDSVPKAIRGLTPFQRSLKPKPGQKTIFDEAIRGMGDFRQNADQLKQQDPLEGFFKNGKQVADDLGDIAVELGRIADALDNPFTRGAADLFLGIAAHASLLLGLLGPLPGMFGFILDNLKPLQPVAEAVGDAFDHISRGVAAIGNLHLPNLNLGRLFGGGGGGGGGVSPLTIQPPNLDWIDGVQRQIGNLGEHIQGTFTHLTAPIGHAMSQVQGSVQQAAINSAAFLNSIPGRLGGLAARFGQAAAGWAARIVTAWLDLPGTLLGLFSGLGAAIGRVIGSIHLNFDFPDPPSWLKAVEGPGGILLDRLTAAGGIFDGAQWRVIAEAGKEAVVPLTGPLSSVDPSVRELSAIARGLTSVPGPVSQTVPGKTINVEQNITTPATDPVAAASEFLNHLTAVVA